MFLVSCYVSGGELRNAVFASPQAVVEGVELLADPWLTLTTTGALRFWARPLEKAMLWTADNGLR